MQIVVMKKFLDGDFSKIAKFENELKVFKSSALPFAIRNTLTRAAWWGQQFAKGAIRTEFINRNKWTIGSIKFNRAKGSTISTMESSFGSLSPYMLTQELGGIETKKGLHGVAIPTAYAAGQGMNAQPRTRNVQKKNKFDVLRLSHAGTGAKSRKARNKLIIEQAKASGHKEVFLDLGQTQGIFRVVGKGKRARIKMLYDLSRQSVSIPKHPIINPASERASDKIPSEYLKSLEFQLKRHKLFL